MSIANDLEMEIRRLIAERYSQREIAKKLNVKGPQLSVLLSGVRSFGGLKIETLDKMFPNAKVDFHGEPRPSALNILSNNTGNTINNGGGISAFRAGLVMAIIRSDVAAPEKDKVLKIIADYEA